MVTSTLTNILRGMGLSEAREPRLQDVLDGGSSAAQHAAGDLATPTNGASADSGDQYYGTASVLTSDSTKTLSESSAEHLWED